ncbi:UvrD-helicase domain-containing protein [Alkalicoccobacillus porphyridii]|uniref:DNA 3'-5' helicase n=1 Tax=Alkalicoccobacillus porphyridii TaxID=2597270 RepID=A0A553ZTE0_9BACI|nr:ATP-dependent helicase [Alkalicoccobacillus porphyridii]TSB44730.1 ATP-dependent helicase [Alkalicoccobacillus porphyridii]
MKTAFYQQKQTDITSIDRSEWQRMYQAAKRGEVTCVHCQQPVRMHMSIHQEPYFDHPRSLFDCENEIKKLEKSKEVSLPPAEEQKENRDSSHTFVLPKSRAITATHQPNSPFSWKAPETVTAYPDFQPPTKSKLKAKHPYLHTLEQSNVVLDDTQWQAVSHTQGPLLLVAGAGSGKTRVLTSRAAYMLADEGIAPEQMILVTFTAKAAREMKERMQLYPGLDAKMLHKLMIGTFHSIFYKMLIHHQRDAWNHQNLLKEWQRTYIVKEAGRELGLEEKEFAYDQALTQISWWKNHLLTPSEIKPKDIWEERCVHLYKRYEEIRMSRSAFDFDDMLSGCYELLTTNPLLLERYQERFSYVSVDEFQDINKVQFKLIQLLSEPQRNLCVVGDDDQSIYAFRGSDPEYLRSFSKEYPEGQTILLNKNYRSSHPIVSLANNVITSNKHRVEKRLRAQFNKAHSPILFFPYDEEEEATMIVTDIKELIENGASPRDFAILYRTNVHSMALFERLIESSIPFVIEQEGDSFYKRKVVRKALAYLRISQHPDNTQAMDDLLGALFLKQERLADVKRMSILHDCSLLEALRHLDGLQPFQLKKLEELPSQCNQIRTLSPESALTLVEQELGFKDYLKKQGNEGNKMDKGSDDLARLKVSARQHNSIQSFLMHIDHIIAKQEEKQKQPSESDALQLMTIHRSKGLEFKHIYLLGAVEGSLPHDYALDAWRDGDDAPLEEERRLMYVAMTRAKEHLAISVPMMYRGRRAQRSRFVREMGRHIPPSTRKEVSAK